MKFYKKDKTFPKYGSYRIKRFFAIFPYKDKTKNITYWLENVYLIQRYNTVVTLVDIFNNREQGPGIWENVITCTILEYETYDLSRKLKCTIMDELQRLLDYYVKNWRIIDGDNSK